MPTPESLKTIRDNIAAAENGIRRLESEISMMEKAGIDATVPRNDVKMLRDQLQKLRSVYG